MVAWQVRAIQGGRTGRLTLEALDCPMLETQGFSFANYLNELNCQESLAAYRNLPILWETAAGDWVRSSLHGGDVALSGAA
jgi:hypothetical protein